MKSSIQLYHKAFYPCSVLLTAIEDYRHIAAIALSDEGNYFQCAFTNCVIDSTRVICEFDNYLIELLNSQGANSEL